MKIDETQTAELRPDAKKDAGRFQFFDLDGSPIAKCLIDGRTYRFEDGKWEKFGFAVEIEREKAIPLSESELMNRDPEAIKTLQLGIGSEKEMSDREIRKRLFLLLYPDYLEREFNAEIEKFTEGDREKIRDAVEFAKEKHKGQYREENTPYYVHCLDTALNGIQNGEGAIGVVVSLLHDTLEDTSATYDEIAGKFGEAAAKSVMVLSKVRDGKKIPEPEYYAGIGEHPPLVKIKGYDRLSNVISMHLAPEWPKRENYIAATNRDVIPMVKKVDPALARKIELALDFVKDNPSLTAEEQKKIADWKKIREMSKSMG